MKEKAFNIFDEETFNFTKHQINEIKKLYNNQDTNITNEQFQKVRLWFLYILEYQFKLDNSEIISLLMSNRKELMFYEMF